MSERVEIEEWFPIDWYHIRNRGWVATCYAPDPTRIDDLKAMAGRPIMMHGKVYRILGVETYAMPGHAKVRPVGFLVDGDPPDAWEAARFSGLTPL